MQRDVLEKLLRAVAQGELPIAAACEQLALGPITACSAALLDTHRELRTGFCETIFGQGKSLEQLVEIVGTLRAEQQRVLITRLDTAPANALCERFAGGTYHAQARCLTFSTSTTSTRSLPRDVASAPSESSSVVPSVDDIAIVCAGTADLPVAEEARITAEFYGARVARYIDVGVAGLHRLLVRLADIRRARVVIAIAGMEGALASVLGGLISAPLIAVPTSVGYGVNENGRTALHAMLTSCAEGLTVVNIDNGFGAACAALRILRLNATHG